MMDNCCTCEPVDDVCPVNPTCSSFTGYTLVGSVTPDVTSGASASFGTMPPGMYFIVYCEGAYQSDVPSTTNWTVQADNSVEGYKYTITDCLSGTVSDWVLPTIGGAFTTQANAQAAQISAGIISSRLSIALGDVSIALIDPIFTDNAAGSPSPVFNLFQQNKPTRKITFVSACASWLSAGVDATCDFTIRNRNCFDWCGTVITLDSSGGVSGATTLTGQKLVGLSNQTFTIAFNASNTLITASLRLSNAAWGSDVLIVVYLGPIIVATPSVDAFASDFCGTFPTAFYLENRTRIALVNNGFWTFTPSLVMSFTGTAVGSTLACVMTNPFTCPLPPTLTCNGGTGQTPTSGAHNYFYTNGPIRNVSSPPATTVSQGFDLIVTDEGGGTVATIPLGVTILQ